MLIYVIFFLNKINDTKFSLLIFHQNDFKGEPDCMYSNTLSLFSFLKKELIVLRRSI